jgi:hypothetical protein
VRSLQYRRHGAAWVQLEVNDQRGSKYHFLKAPYGEAMVMMEVLEEGPWTLLEFGAFAVQYS